MNLKKKILSEMKKRDKVFPGHVHLVDLFNERYISRKIIYDFIMENEIILKGQLLDFGCGSKQYATCFWHADSYIGLDVDSAKQYGFSADGIMYYDGKKIPFDDNYFDSCVAIEVFEHIFDIQNSLCEIFRVLKPGGYLLATCPMVYPLHMIPNDYWRYTEFGLEKLLKNHGFEIEKIERSSSFENTMHRLKILKARKANRNNGLLNECRVKINTVIHNLSFVFSRQNSDNSIFPLEIFVIAQKNI